MNHNQEQEHHITGAGTYLAVFIGLIVLTVLTTAVSFVNLHAFNVVVALGIATCKMLLVSLWFMHVKHSSALTKVVLIGALLWLGIMLAFTLMDFHSRGWMGTLGR
jgi:cytochrome c oxidase subunit 4